MEKYLIESESFLKSIEVIEGSTRNFYFYINLLYFIHYINNFPKLKEEKVNRLKFYFSNLFSRINNINIERIHIRLDNTRMGNLFVDELLKASNIPRDSKNLLPFFMAIIITLQSYREISNLIPKRNIFTKTIENKIYTVVDAIIAKLKKEPSKYYSENLDVPEVYDLCEKVLANKYFAELKLRQKNRFLGRNVNKYPIDSFVWIQNIKQIMEKYDKIISNGTVYSYERSFIKNILELIEKF